MDLAQLLETADLARKGGDFGGAACIYEQVLRTDRSSAQAAAGLGICLQRLGRPSHALPYLAPVASQGWNDPELYVSLGNCYFVMGQMEIAANAFGRAVVLDTHPARSLVLLAHAQVKAGRGDEAEYSLKEALALQPDLASAYDLMAFLLPELGRFDEAKEFAKIASTIEPENATYLARYVYAGRVTTDERDIVERLEERAASETIKTADRIRAEYALGKAFEDLGDYEKSLRHFVLANELAASEMASHGQGFSREGHRREVDYLIETFTADHIRSRSAHGSDSRRPVFIVGMMRSGTTLTEQILSSHPEVGGAGELDFWVKAGPRTLHASGAQIAKTAQEYLELLESKAPGKARVCDKMPQNYMSIGPIVSAFPNARFVHCRRNAKDTCLSIYTVPFAFHPPFAYSFKNLAFTWKQYRRIMEHWRSVLRPDQLMEVDYEELVNDQEAVTRRLIDFLGLEWNEACLHPERNERMVNTPSRWQVRQPINNKSVGRWDRFAPWLEPLLRQWGCADDF